MAAPVAVDEEDALDNVGAPPRPANFDRDARTANPLFVQKSFPDQVVAFFAVEADAEHFHQAGFQRSPLLAFGGAHTLIVWQQTAQEQERRNGGAALDVCHAELSPKQAADRGRWGTGHDHAWRESRCAARSFS